MVAAGTKGIGLAIAKDLADEGCMVSICGRDSSKFSTLLSVLGSHCRAYECDVTQLDQIENWYNQTVSDLGQPDILVTNTGGPPAGAWTTMTDDQWQAGFDSTLLNVVRMVRFVTPAMIEKGWGRIIHVTSLVAVEPNPLLPISSTIRGGMKSLTRLQAQELAPHGITVNSVLPGHTMTDRQVHLAEFRAKKERISTEEALKLTADSVPMRRLANPEEIAAPVLFLCSEKASYVSGISMLVDGGTVKSSS